MMFVCCEHYKNRDDVTRWQTCCTVTTVLMDWKRAREDSEASNTFCYCALSVTRRLGTLNLVTAFSMHTLLKSIRVIL
jgi:hypothetical protein